MLQNSWLKIIGNQAAKFGCFSEVHKSPNIEQIYKKLFGLNKQHFLIGPRIYFLRHSGG
jgi:hypothetical protein